MTDTSGVSFFVVDGFSAEISGYSPPRSQLRVVGIAVVAFFPPHELVKVISNTQLHRSQNLRLRDSGRVYSWFSWVAGGRASQGVFFQKKNDPRFSA